MPKLTDEEKFAFLDTMLGVRDDGPTIEFSVPKDKLDSREGRRKALAGLMGLNDLPEREVPSARQILAKAFRPENRYEDRYIKHPEAFFSTLNDIGRKYRQIREDQEFAAIQNDIDAAATKADLAIDKRPRYALPTNFNVMAGPAEIDTDLEIPQFSVGPAEIDPSVGPTRFEGQAAMEPPRYNQVTDARAVEMAREHMRGNPDPRRDPRFADQRITSTVTGNPITPGVKDTPLFNSYSDEDGIEYLGEL